MKKLISVLVLLMLFRLTDLPAQELVKVRYLPHWLHQAQFAGYYMAKEKGIYEKYGLDVEILPGGPNAPAIPDLVEHKTDITSTFLSGAIKAEANGMDVVNICQLSQRSALMYITKASSNITTPEDFNGKKIGIWRSDFQELPMAFLDKYHIEAEVVPITSTVNLFLRGGIDVMCVMWYNEYHQVLNFGIDQNEINVFDFNELGLDFPEDAIVCLNEYFKENTETCHKFVQATIAGWEYTFAHKDEAVDVTIEYMEAFNIPANRPHQYWMLNRTEDIFKADSDTITGTLNNEDYMLTGGVLLEFDAIEEIPPFEKFNKTPLPNEEQGTGI